jgi:hypothetical protein
MDVGMTTVTTPSAHGLGAWRDRRMPLSTLWIFVTLNYLYCDVLGLMDADSLRGFLQGTVSGMEITPTFLVGAGVLMEIPMAMVLLSRVLPYAANRRANVAAGALMTVVQIGSLLVGSGPAAFYVFFSVVEVATTAFVVWYAWTWSPRTTIAVR